MDIILIKCNRSQVLHDRIWVEASDHRMVGSFTASKLPVRIFAGPTILNFLMCVLSGDLLMAFAWSLPTGFETPITYFYVTYFAVLLIHRQMRDDENCEKK